MKKIISSPSVMILLAVIFGVIVGIFGNENMFSFCQILGDIAVKLMKLVAVPLLFLSIISAFSHFKDLSDAKVLGYRIFSWTTFTTLLAALVAEAVYYFASPIVLNQQLIVEKTNSQGASKGFFEILLDKVPSNFLGIFLEDNVIAAVFLSIAIAVATLSLREKEREIVFNGVGSVLAVFMKLVHRGIKYLPIVVFAFVVMLVVDVRQNTSQDQSLNAIFGHALTVLAANLIQGIIVLPVILKFYNISPINLFLNVKEALVLAFFSRSSTATLPVSLDVAINKAKLNKDVARLSLPLCTTINMNGCAQFILLTFYFVSAFNGMPLSPGEHVLMIGLSVIAAIGNAGVPMGCFFLASSILASKDVPIYLMGSILPLYTFLDMVETSLNVWSDLCVTKLVSRES